MRTICALLLALLGFASAGCDAPPQPSTESTTRSPQTADSGKAPDLVRWEVSESRDAMTDAVTTSIFRSSTDTYRAWVGGERDGTLYFRCSKGRLADAAIAIGGAASVEYDTDSHTVRYRLDGGKPTTQHWLPSKNDKALFAPNPAQFLAQLEHAKSLVFEFDPFNTPSRADLTFDLGGLKEIVLSQPNCTAGARKAKR